MGSNFKIMVGWENPLHIKFCKYSKYVTDDFKIGLKTWNICWEKLLSSFNKQTKIHSDLLYKDIFLALCDVYVVPNSVNPSMEIQVISLEYWASM